MWIMSASLLSINYPNLGGFLFGTLVMGFIIHYLIKWANKKADTIYKIIFPE